MALPDTLKAVALAYADDIDKALAFENIDEDAVARLDHTLGGLTWSVHFDANFAHKSHRGEVVLGEVSAHGFRQLLFFHKFDEADLGRLVSVFGLGLVLRNHTRPCLQHRRRPHIALRIEELRHADFLT